MMHSLKASTILLVFLSALCVILGWGWLSQTPSFEEMQGDTFRAVEYFRAMKSVGGWPWWTPNYLMGQSHAAFVLNILPVSFMVGLAALFNAWLPTITSFKLAGLTFLFCGGLSMFFFSRKLIKCEWTALFCAVLYSLSAQYTMRLAMLEHLTTAACMIFSPLILLLILKSEENPSWKNALLLAMAVAGMVLCYVKIFMLFLPAAAVFFFLRFFNASRTGKQNICSGCLKGALLTIPLGLLPLFPTLRESQWLAGFEMDPFAGWQQNYSFFSALSWIDYRNLLSAGSLIGAFDSTRHPAVDFYLGGSILLGIFAPFFLVYRKPEIIKSNEWQLTRMFTALLLLATWFASGPRNILSSHFAFLSGSLPMPDVSIAIAWLMLAAMVFLIWRLWFGVPYKAIWASLSILIFLLVPGFRLLEVFPFYGDVRAPSAVWTAFGTFSAVLAAGCGYQLIALNVKERKLQVAAVAIILAFIALDISFLQKEFFTPGLSEATFKEYEETQDVLRRAPLPGNVYFISGRYFYLTTPRDSQRALSTEALLRHVQLRWIRQMENRAMRDPKLMQAYFNFFGTAYIVIDRKDPDSPPELQKHFKEIFPTYYENEYFTILENKECLAPAYLATHLVKTPKNSFLAGETLLKLASDSFVPVEAESGSFDGTINEKGAAEIPENLLKTALPMPERLKLQAPRMQNYHQFTVEGLSTNARGLVVVTEAYHPDWQAVQNGVKLPVFRALGALLSVQVDNPGPVNFYFVPPWWYSASLSLSTASWVGAFALLGFFALPIAPKRWRNTWEKGNKEISYIKTEIVRPPITRSLVIIPTWNEIEGIANILQTTLTAAPGCDILVVDDNSPDGTAAKVKTLPEFGSRLHLLERTGKLGLGSAYREGFQWAISKGYDACVEMDADLSHNPEDIQRLIAALDDKTDAAIGSRYLDGVRVINWPEHRLLLSTMASRYVRVITKLPLTDATSGFKALRCSALKELDWQMLKAEGYAFQIELHFALWRQGFGIREIPIIFTERRSGITKMNGSIAVEAVFRVLQLGWIRLIRPHAGPEKKIASHET